MFARLCGSAADRAERFPGRRTWCTWCSGQPNETPAIGEGSHYRDFRDVEPGDGGETFALDRPDGGVRKSQAQRIIDYDR